ncbi:sigma-54-dependent transcriptional regulator [Pleionea mediterranea]|uniref:Two component Fis family sigma54 specific transcriptional regulator n=1 Tax=Pleionea mediterranea TaxID=523701 RepID=A0A316FM18_9GAMM|nr:sigma-54 dependent transcriptional regulator [Pleionea mediterranea]PWK49162.1 two component Fis family sigma54 specific transcriptional regulator [Pleionea mediterranea]
MNTNRVLVLEDDQTLREALTDTLELSGYQVDEAEDIDSAIVKWSSSQPDIVVSDVNLGERNGKEFLKFVRGKDMNTPFIFMTAYGTIDMAVSAMQEGASEFIQKPFKPTILLEILERYKHTELNEKLPIIADDKSQQLYQLAKRIAATDSTVLLNGPSGSGKEVMANYIHSHSSRSEQPFVALNCAAIPENMLEATLFGYEKGAFTGAYQSCPGKFEQAQNGTILLDEISEMDLSLQAKLLRVLQEREVERLGSRKMIPLNVRVIATTNRDLKKEVQEKRFREDLYFRLNVFPMTCLALSERTRDIIPLAEFLLEKYARQNNLDVPSISSDAKSKLLSYNWPGNVRELDNVVQRCLILSGGVEVDSEHLMFETTHEIIDSTTQEIEDDNVSALGAGVRQHEYQIIIDALKQCNGKKKQVAEELGISPRTLRYKLAKMRELGYEMPA